MGSDNSRARYQGFLIADPRWKASNLWAAESDYDEGDLVVAQVSPDSGVTTNLRLVASGTPSAATAINVQTLRGGMPGTGRSGFVYRTGGSGDWFGWNAPYMITGYKRLAAYSTTNNGEFDPRPVRRAADQGIVIVASQSTGGAGTTNKAVVYGIDADGTTTSGPTTVGSTEVVNVCPDIVVLPSGRLMVYALVQDTDQNKDQIRMYFTDDGDGSSGWNVGEHAVLEAAVDVSANSITRCRVAYGDGQWMLTLRWGTLCRQWASIDGALVEEVGDGSGFTSQGHDLRYVAGHFVFADTDNTNLAVRRVADAFDYLGDETEIDPGAVEGGSAALVVDDDEALYLYGGGSNANFAVSRDAGLTWSASDVQLGLRYADAAMAVASPSGCVALGRVVMACNGNASVAQDGSLNLIYMGGYSEATFPEDSKSRDTSSQAQFVSTNMGLDLLSNQLTDNSTATPTEALQTDGSVRVTTGAGDVGAYDYTLAAGAGYFSQFCRFRAKYNAGAQEGGSLYIRSGTTDGGGDHTEIQIEFRSGSTVIADVNGGTLDTIAISGDVEVLVALVGQDLTVYTRAYDDLAKDYTNTTTSTTITLAGATASNRMRIEVPASSGLDVFEAHYSIAGVSVGNGSSRHGASLATGQTNPDDLFARPYATVAPVLVTNDVSIRATDGPTYVGETFTMTPDHERPIEFLFPDTYTDPTVKWRSSTTTQAMDIAVDLMAEHAVTDENTFLLNDTIGIWWSGNVRGITLAYWDVGAGSWSNFATFDMSYTVRFTRHGDVVVPDTGGSGGDSRYFPYHDAVGGWFEFPTSGDIRPIIGSGEGNYDSAAINEKRPWFRLDDIDGGEDASGTTGRIWMPSGVGIVHLAGVNVARGLRIRVRPAAGGGPAPPDGYYEAKAVVGPVVVFGRRPGRQRAHVRESFVDVEEFADGSKRLHPRNADARQRRRIEIAWPEVDLTTARDTDDPDFVRGTTTSGGEPIAHDSDTPLLVDGLFRYLNGPATPCVMLQHIPQGTPDTPVALQSKDAIYGHIRSQSVRWDQFLGEPNVDDVVRMPTLVFEEL